MLLNWHNADPVSTKELNRNAAIFAIQNNKNPFIDYPEFANCIWGTADCSSIGTKDFIVKKSIQLFPNPVKDKLQIEWKNNTEKIETINIVSLFGNNLISTSNPENINVEFLPKGMYIISIKTAKNVYTANFLKN